LATTEQNAAFIRQRRSIITVSFLLLFVQLSKIQIENINLLGTTFKISDPSLFGLLLWVLWAYFLLRYYQYFRLAKSDMRQLGHRMTRYQQKYCVNIFNKTHEPKDIPVSFAPPFRIHASGATLYKTADNKWTIDTTIFVRKHPKEASPDDLQVKQSFAISNVSRLWMWCRAYAYMIIHTADATEYYLPFLVALFPVFSALIT
jgi:hypothetical protein